MNILGTVSDREKSNNKIVFYRINLNFVNSSNMYEKKKQERQPKKNDYNPDLLQQIVAVVVVVVVRSSKRYAHKKQICFTLKSSSCKVVSSGKN
uniref:Uncharacterized protein n=1 Tax=Glossina palpalis gambiensis TaxID=67801 RepID=A0A1B0B281_9MUSC